MAKLTRRKDKNGLVLEKGEGQRKDGRYYYEWSDELGKRHFVYATTLAELRNKEKTVVFDVLTGISQDGANLTLNEAIEYWIKVRQDDVAIGALKPTTLSQYLRTYDNHVRDSLGTLKIKDITKTKLSAFYKRKMADGLGLSQITNIAKPINQTLAIAEEEHWTRRSPTHGALKAVTSASKKLQSEDETQIKALTEEQQVSFLQWLGEDPARLPLKCIVETFLYSGMRIGELSGLQAPDVSDKFIKVRHSFAYFPLTENGRSRMRRVMQAPKSAAGKRTLPLLEPTANAIAQYRGWIEDNGFVLKEPVNGFDSFVFMTRKGWPLTSAGVNSSLKRAVEAFNKDQAVKGSELRLPCISCHWLRRTFATRLCEAGVSLRVAQYLMGHEDINMTANVYTAVQGNLTTSEMLKLVGRGGESRTTFLQQTYGKFSRNTVLDEIARKRRKAA